MEHVMHEMAVRYDCGLCATPAHTEFSETIEWNSVYPTFCLGIGILTSRDVLFQVLILCMHRQTLPAAFFGRFRTLG